MRTLLRHLLLPLRQLSGAASWYANGAAWLSAGLLLVVLTWQDWHLVVSVQSADQAMLKPRRLSRPDDLSQVLDPSVLTERVDFISTLPRFADPDATIRFTSRLAQNQDVRVSQMQSDFVATDAKKLGQTKFTLQLRGDYRNIKNVTIGLLAKFPGLTLQRLNVHHRDATSGSPTDKSSDESTLELLQYTRPAVTP